VPAKVIGPVQPGDYILPSEFGNGFAKAVHPDDMKIEDYEKIAGVAWSEMSQLSENISMIRIAVGLNTHDLTAVIKSQQSELDALRNDYNELKQQMEDSQQALAELVPGYAAATGKNDDEELVNHTNVQSGQKQIDSHDDVVDHAEDDIIYFTISEAQVEEALSLARAQYEDMLDDETKNLLQNPHQKPDPRLSNQDQKPAANQRLAKPAASDMDLDKQIFLPVDEHPFWQRIDSDPQYKAEIIDFIQSKFEKAVHTHKEHAHKFSNLNIVD